MQQSPKTIGLAFMEYIKPNGIETVNSVINELGLMAEALKFLRITSFFKNPALTADKKEEWIAKIADALKIGPLSRNLTKVLLKVNQLNIISKVVSATKELRLDLFGIGEGHAVSVTPLTTSQREAVTGLIKKIGGFKEAIVIENTNPHVLGGIALTAGDKLADATIKRQLKDILKLVT